MNKHVIPVCVPESVHASWTKQASSRITSTSSTQQLPEVVERPRTDSDPGHASLDGEYHPESNQMIQFQRRPSGWTHARAAVDPRDRPEGHRQVPSARPVIAIAPSIAHPVAVRNSDATVVILLVAPTQDASAVTAVA
jgi:hypothetical protein